MGRKSTSAGNTFEQWLEITHAYYREQGWAFVQKQHVPCRPSFRDGRMVWSPVGKALPDYGGWMTPGGRGVLFEAKSTSQKEAWAKPRDRRHQYEYLVESVNFGVVAFYLVYWQKSEEIRLYPAQHLGVWSESLKRVEGAVVSIHNGWADWLSVVHSW